VALSATGHSQIRRSNCYPSLHGSAYH
jgi:hypothetical protein